MHTRVMVEGQVGPYLFANYNMNAFMSGAITSSLIHNPMVRFVNCFAEALNRFHLLPRFMVIIPDQDIIKAINYYDYGISKIIQRCLEWVLCEFDCIIEARKEDLLKKRPGAVCALEPKIIWVKMIDCPGASRVMSLREKFNAILEESLFKYKQTYIAEIKLDRMHFDHNNNLFPTGQVRFWRELDSILKAFDRQYISLKPKPVISMATASKSREDNERKSSSNKEDSRRQLDYHNSKFCGRGNNAGTTQSDNH